MNDVSKIIDEVIDKNYGFCYLDKHPEGAMRTKDKRWFGYFADFFVIRRDVLDVITPIEEELDGHIWIEVTLARLIKSALYNHQVYGVDCHNEDRGNRNIFENMLGGESWMSASHHIGQKLDWLEKDNKELSDKLRLVYEG